MYLNKLKDYEVNNLKIIYEFKQNIEDPLLFTEMIDINSC